MKTAAERVKFGFGWNNENFLIEIKQEGDPIDVMNGLISECRCK